MTIYWNKLLVVAILVAGIVLLGVFGKNLPSAVLPTLLGGLGTALAMLLPPTEKARTTLRPPPMPESVRIDTIPAPPPTMTEEKR